MHLGKGLGRRPSQSPKKSSPNFSPRESPLSFPQVGSFEFCALVSRASQSAGDTSSPHSFPMFSY